MKNIIFIFFSWFVLFPTQGNTETLIVMLYQGANPPYNIISNDKRSGIFVDLFKKLSEITEHNFILKDFPVARGGIEFELGHVDIEPGVNEKWRMNSNVLGVYSIPYEHSKEVIVFKAKNKLIFHSPKDLYGKSIGIVRGYTYPDFEDAFEKNKINKIYNKSEHLLLKQLEVDRVKYVFIGDKTLKYFQQTNEKYRPFLVGGIVSQEEVKFRIHPKKAHVLPSINAALKQLIDSGEIQAIYDKYQYIPE